MFEIILKCIIFIALTVLAVIYYRKHKNEKYNIFRVLFAVALLTMVLSFLIPGNNFSYTGDVETGYNPIGFSDLFLNATTAMNISVATGAYLFLITILYVILKKAGKYDVLVNNTAATFKKNKSLFMVLTVFILGLMSLFTGEVYTMIVFIPFLISVIRKLGYSKEISITATIGAVLLGNAGALYAYSNQVLRLSVTDNLMQKVVVTVVALVCLLGFVLVFCKKPVLKEELVKTKEKKMLPIYIISGLVFVLLVLGFVNWSSYFEYDGFDKFLESIRKTTIGNTSIFDALIGSPNIMAAFGSWTINTASALLVFVIIALVLIYRVNLLESIANGAKKVLPYIGILVLSNLILVNIFQSGLFYSIQMLFTKKHVNIFNSSVISLFSSLTISDVMYASQFTMESVLRNTKAVNYEDLLAVVFQAVYSLGLIISPVSALALFGMKYTETSYKEWLKHIWKFFVIMLIVLLVVIKILIDGFTIASIIAFVLLIVALAFLTWLSISKIISSSVKKGAIEAYDKIQEKEETKVTKVEVKEEKKESKNNKKKSNNKKSKK